MNNVQKMYITKMPDGSRWGIAVAYIALNRAVYYADADDPDGFQIALNESCDVFSDPAEIANWAKNNMDWDEVKDVAVLIEDSVPADMQEGWINGDWNLT